MPEPGLKKLVCDDSNWLCTYGGLAHLQSLDSRIQKLTNVIKRCTFERLLGPWLGDDNIGITNNNLLYEYIRVQITHLQE